MRARTSIARSGSLPCAVASEPKPASSPAGMAWRISSSVSVGRIVALMMRPLLVARADEPALVQEFEQRPGGRSDCSQVFFFQGAFRREQQGRALGQAYSHQVETPVRIHGF